MANSMLQSCGLGCQLLGPCCSTYLGTNLIHTHLLWVRPHRSPALLLCRTVEDDSPKPSCNMQFTSVWKSWLNLLRFSLVWLGIVVFRPVLLQNCSLIMLFAVIECLRWCFMIGTLDSRVVFGQHSEFLGSSIVYSSAFYPQTNC